MGIGQELHERLCAYVFGELQGTERTAFEAELEREPALRAERARLEATIGLVKRAIPDEGLPADVRRDVLASARRSRFRVLRGKGLARVAAAVVLLAGGALVVRFLSHLGESNGPFPSDVLDGGKVAQRAAPDRLVQRDLGAVPAARERAPTQNEAAARRDKLDALGYRGGEEAPALAQLEALRGLGYSYGGAAGSAGSELRVMTGEPAAQQQALGLPATAQAADPATVSLAALGEPQAQGRYAHRSGGQADSQVGLGGGEGGRAFARESVPLVPLDLSKGKYRGPGDTKPAGSSGPLVLGSGLPAPQSEADSFEVDYYRDRDTRQALEALGYGGGEELNGLGYVGGDDEAKEGSDWLLGRKAKAKAVEPTQAREQRAAAQAEQLLASWRLQPGEAPADMFFRCWGDNPFVLSQDEGLSTFAVDVDTASYALARSYLTSGRLPPRDAVRTEEFVNYFKPDQPAPPSGMGGDPFAIGLELAPSPFGGDPRVELLRVTVRGKDVASFERQPVALTLVIDNSGSMAGERLELVRRSLFLLFEELYASDSVAVVVFSQTARELSAMVPAGRRGELENALLALGTEGGTNVEAGLRQGFALAAANLTRNAVNRVILCSDGVGNIGETKGPALLELVREHRERGIYLNTVGVGMGNHDDAFLEQLADQGDGVCNYVDSDAEARRVFVDGLARTLQPIARDVKIQVEFDPAQVESWRQLGYENRALRHEDFRDDAIDAGEVNAGHQVTALYEIVRQVRDGGPLATVRLRYKPPFAIDRGAEGARAKAEGEQALEISSSIHGSAARPGFAAASAGFRRSALVAQFAEVLRRSVHARGDSFGSLIEEARRLERELGDPDVTELVALLERANPLLDRRAQEDTPRIQTLLDELGRLHYERGQRERKRVTAEPEVLAREAAEIRRLEGEVRVELGVPERLDPETLEQLRDIGYAEDR